MAFASSQVSCQISVWGGRGGKGWGLKVWLETLNKRKGGRGVGPYPEPPQPPSGGRKGSALRLTQLARVVVLDAVIIGLLV